MSTVDPWSLIKYLEFGGQFTSDDGRADWVVNLHREALALWNARVIPPDVSFDVLIAMRSAVIALKMSISLPGTLPHDQRVLAAWRLWTQTSGIATPARFES